MTYLEMLRARQEAERRELNELLAVEPADFTPEQEARATALADQIEARQAEINTAEERERRAEAANRGAAERQEGTEGRERTERSPTVVQREERTYTAERDRRGEASFFADAFNMGRGDFNARERLERHARETLVEGEGVSQRATTTSTYAGLVVPQYLVDLVAPVVHAGRAFANTCQGLPLPDQGMVFYITKGTTAADVDFQGGTQTPNQNIALHEQDQAWSDIQVNVQTIGGQQNVSRQSLERGTPGLDQLIYRDLAAAYGVKVDKTVLTGTGTGYNGALNAGGTQIVNTAGTQVYDVGTFYSKVAGAVNAVQSNRFMAPDHILMHPRRWAWLLSQTDSSFRPLITISGAQGPYNALTSPPGAPHNGAGGPAGTFQGIPVIVDPNVPTTAGTENEDQVVVYHAPDCLLWEDGPLPRQLRFEEVLGDSLTVKFVAYGFIAFTAERYPTGLAYVGGDATVNTAGLIAPTF